MSQETFSQEDLETFKWDETVPDIDFFSEVEAPKEKVKEEEKTGEETEDTTEDTSKEEVVDLFGETEQPVKEEEEQEVTDDVTKEKKKTGPKEKLSNIEIASFLKEKGIIDFELEEGEELDELDAEDIIESGFEASLENRLEETLTGLPESVKNLVKFAAKGGDPDEYFSKITSSTPKGISKGLDITDEQNQINFMKYQLQKEGHDEEYIDFQIESLKDSGRLETMSVKAFTKWKVEQDKLDAELVKEQENKVRAAREAQLGYKRSLAEKLSTIDNINNLKFSKKDSKELPDYISNASVTLEDGRRISAFHKDLFDSIKDPDKVLVIAKLVKNGFDFKDIEKTVATQQARQVKEDLQRQQQGRKINSAGGSSQPKRLADYFPD